jgi:hypothetical protein
MKRAKKIFPEILVTGGRGDRIGKINAIINR